MQVGSGADLCCFSENKMMIQPIEWKNGEVRFLDQKKLPEEEHYCQTGNLADLEEAILKLKIRGAPLLGIAAAYGVLLGVRDFQTAPSEVFLKKFNETCARLARTRPTAKNLFWALERMKEVVRLNSKDDVPTLFEKLVREALAVHEEDRQMCDAIGKFGAELIPESAVILTHCNTGALATGGIGTAQGIITTAHAQGKTISVFADETRPLLQGARLTAWELQRAGINVTLITDSTAAWTIRTKKVHCIITGADRIAANGDSANKIGTYNLAVLAKEHSIPFYIAAPVSTIDTTLTTGEEIVIEERGSEEVAEGFGRRTAPKDIKVFSPAFDVTPHELITALVTDKGILRPPFFQSIQSVMR